MLSIDSRELSIDSIDYSQDSSSIYNSRQYIDYSESLAAGPITPVVIEVESLLTTVDAGAHSDQSGHIVVDTVDTVGIIVYTV